MLQEYYNKYLDTSSGPDATPDEEILKKVSKMHNRDPLHSPTRPKKTSKTTKTPRRGLNQTTTIAPTPTSTRPRNTPKTPKPISPALKNRNKSPKTPLIKYHQPQTK
jgi:hypothetical protein